MSMLNKNVERTGREGVGDAREIERSQVGLDRDFHATDVAIVRAHRGVSQNALRRDPWHCGQNNRLHFIFHSGAMQHNPCKRLDIIFRKSKTCAYQTEHAGRHVRLFVIGWTANRVNFC